MTPAAVIAVVSAAVVVLGTLRWRRPPARRPVGGPVRARPPRPVRRRATLAGAIAGGVLGVWAVGPVLASAVAIAAVASRHAVRVGRARRRQREVDAAVPDAVELLIALVRAGATPTQAVVDAATSAPAPTRAGFAAVVHQLERGRRLADALAALPGVLGPGAQPVAEAIGAADRYGLPLGPVLERLADDARATRRRLAEAHARTLPVRLSFPLVTCTLPSFVLLAIVPAVLGTLSSLRGTGP